MDQVQEDLHHRLHQLRFLASETDDPLAERLVRDLIVELEDRLMAEALNGRSWNKRHCARADSVLPASPPDQAGRKPPGDAGRRFCISST